MPATATAATAIGRPSAAVAGPDGFTSAARGEPLPATAQE